MDQLPPLRPLKQRASMPSLPAPRRHSTSFQPEAAQESASNASVETLYDHPSVRIIAFTAGKSAFERPGAGQEDKPGTLASSSQFERSIAVGAFQIYRAPGSVAFLRSGTALQPILPKSQVWCLDEQSSKFVLQIRRPNYWRIEVPVDNDEEIRTAHRLREVLDKILQFEKTPCPFERSFTVELPETPKTAIKKRTWTPPVRTVSMNWPPGSPVTPPPEFTSRTRFYNPGARRFSDFGVDTSRTGLTPAGSPQTVLEHAQEDTGKPATPTRPERRHMSSSICGPLLEEPEPMSTSPSAVPTSIAQIGDESGAQESSKSETLQKSVKSISALTPIENSTAKAPAKKREPIWVTRRKPDADRTSPMQKRAVYTTKSANDIESAPHEPIEATVDSFHKDSGRKSEIDDLEVSPQSAKEPLHDKTGELEAIAGALEGSGQLRVRRTRLAAFASRRAATAPALRLRTPSTSTINSVKETTPDQEEVVQPSSPAESSAESLDSFHSFESWHEPLSPPAGSPIFSPSKTYPYPHENVPLAANKGQAFASTTTPTVSRWDRNSSGAVTGSGCLTPDTPFTEMHEDDRDPVFSKDSTEGSSELTATVSAKTLGKEPSNVPDSDSLSASWSSAASHTSSTSSTDAPIRHRASTTSVSISHRSPRNLSPLPPAATLLNASTTTTPFSNTRRAIRRIPSSIFNTTCEILISPPAHLISLMLKVAARITAGEWRGFVFGLDEGGEVMDVRWDWSDDHNSGGASSSWEVDDFGFANAHRGRRLESDAVTTRQQQVPRPSTKAIEYQDPWATIRSEEQGPDEDDEDGHWSRNWGVD